MKYADSLAAGSVASGSTLGILIPPSSVLIIYGVLTEESIGQLLIAGIVPGLITATFLAITAYLMVRIKPELAPGGKKASLKTVCIAQADSARPSGVLFTLGGNLSRSVHRPRVGRWVHSGTSLRSQLQDEYQGVLECVSRHGEVWGMLMLIVIGGGHLRQFHQRDQVSAYLAVTCPPCLRRSCCSRLMPYFVSGFSIRDVHLGDLHHLYYP